MAKQSLTPSRRAMLAGLAAAPVAGLPAIAGVVAEPDPVLAALEGLARARAACEQVGDDCDDAVVDLVCGDMRNAEVALYSTAPTTPAGAARLLRVIADYLSEEGNLYDIYLEPVLGNAIRNAAALLEQEARS
jgi:hypothetical protein